MYYIIAKIVKKLRTTQREQELGELNIDKVREQMKLK